tara:strand:- start:616 stop:1371 length:756 start_codon:yes stop_codon:yes gene_type:complete
MKSRIIKKVEHFLYDNVEEFRIHHPGIGLVEDWRHSNINDWVLTDDGQVCKILHLGEMKNNKTTRTFVRTVIGSFVCSPTAKMKGPMRTNMYTFSKDGESPSVRRRKKKNASNAEFLFAKYVAKGEDVVEAYLKAFPTDNKNYATGQAKMLLKTDRVRNLVREEIDKYLQDADITPSYLLGEMKDIIDKRETSDRDKLSALNTLIKISGMLDTDKKTESLAVFQGFTREQLGAVQEQRYKELPEGKEDIED